MNGFRCVCAIGLALLNGVASAADVYPSRPIRLIIPSAPGGAPDIGGRLIAGEIGKQMGQQVVVENRPGGTGVLGYEAIARSTPDGYTMGYAAFGVVTNPSVYAKLPYDALRDFQPVIRQVRTPNVLTVTPALPVKSVQELVELARKSPASLSYGSSGNGSSQHLSMELFKQMTGTQILHVPYKAIQQAITEALGGQLQIVCDNMSSMMPHVKAARMRALGVTSPKRSAVLPDVPTVAEQGLPGYEIMPWSGYIVPARVPREIVLRLNAEINKAIYSPVFTEKYVVPNGITPLGGTPEEFSEQLKQEMAKWAKVMRAAGIKPE